MFAKMFGFGTQAPAGATVGHQSFMQRMGNAFCGVIFGILLFLGGVYLIGWNEGRAVHTECAIFSAQQIVKDATCDLSSSLNDDLIYASCPINKNASEVDFAFTGLNYQAKGIYYNARLEQYQITETPECTTTKDSAGGGTTKTCTYSYSNGWHSGPAATFKGPSILRPGTNPPWVEAISSPNGAAGVAPDTKRAPKVIMGTGYVLSGSMIKAASGPSVVGAPQPALSKFVASNTYNPNGAGSGSAPGSLVCDATSCNFRYDDNAYTTASGSAMVGDLRITLTSNPPVDDFSVIGKQNADGTFSEYTFKKCSDYGFLEYSGSKRSSDDLFQGAITGNKILTYVLRIGCFFMLWCGLQLCTGPIALMPDIIPCIGPFIGDLVGMILCCFTCLFATSVFLLVFAVSWVYFRPLIGIPLLCGSVLIMGGLVYWRVKAKRDKDALQGGDSVNQAGYAPPNTGGYQPAPQQYPPQQQYQYPPQQYK